MHGRIGEFRTLTEDQQASLLAYRQLILGCPERSINSLLPSPYITEMNVFRWSKGMDPYRARVGERSRRPDGKPLPPPKNIVQHKRAPAYKIQGNKKVPMSKKEYEEHGIDKFVNQKLAQEFAKNGWTREQIAAELGISNAKDSVLFKSNFKTSDQGSE